MAITYIALTTITVGAGGASTITFSSIPQTYTDLLLKWSGRSDPTSGNNPVDNMYLTFNGSSSSGYAGKLLFDFNGGSPNSVNSAWNSHYVNGGGSTANTFSNNELYIPNYTLTNIKSYNAHMVSENNATSAGLSILAQTSTISAAITSITLQIAGYNFAQNSTATLYGIKNTV